MSQQVDPFVLIASSQPGSAIFSRVQITPGLWETAWLIREESGRFKALGPSPAVSFRAGLIVRDAVGLIPILVRVGPEEPERVYETWLNVHQGGPDGGKRYLEDLATQDRLVVLLFGDQGRKERALRVSNQLMDFARKALEEGGGLATLPPWPMDAFDAARQGVYERYPTVWELWKALDQFSRSATCPHPPASQRQQL